MSGAVAGVAIVITHITVTTSGDAAKPVRLELRDLTPGRDDDLAGFDIDVSIVDAERLAAAIMVGAVGARGRKGGPTPYSG